MVKFHIMYVKQGRYVSRLGFGDLETNF